METEEEWLDCGEGTGEEKEGEIEFGKKIKKKILIKRKMCSKKSLSLQKVKEKGWENGTKHMS